MHAVNNVRKMLITEFGVSEITLTNNKIEDITKAIRSLQNRGNWKELLDKLRLKKEDFINFLRPLMSAGLPLMKNVFKPLAKNALIPLELTAAASATDAAIQRKIFGSGFTALITSNKEMDFVKSLKESVLLIKGVTETIKNDAKEQKDGFLGTLLGILAASVLGNMLERKLKYLDEE